MLIQLCIRSQALQWYPYKHLQSALMEPILESQTSPEMGRKLMKVKNYSISCSSMVNSVISLAFFWVAAVIFVVSIDI